ncbi:MAG: GNAT family N-acetyltransferase [Proteobacteria bacterium]|nr:MAG: GNAT family N-acetyltransferase [Pseudomonadota bacterium]
MPTAVERAATLADVPALSALAKRTFVSTFVEELGVPYPDADLQIHLEKSYGHEATRRLIQDPALRFHVVALEDGSLAGYVLAGSCQLPHPEARPTHGELRRLYVAHEHHGQGYGGLLLRSALGWLAEHFEGPLWIGVWSGNLKAQAMYERQGFEKVGEYDYPVGAWLDREHILRRPA